ncbi:hypothetical protein ABIA39_003628 [Nocardia sp. GAS34]
MPEDRTIEALRGNRSSAQSLYYILRLFSLSARNAVRR